LWAIPLKIAAISVFFYHLLPRESLRNFRLHSSTYGDFIPVVDPKIVAELLENTTGWDATITRKVKRQFCSGEDLSGIDVPGSNANSTTCVTCGGPFSTVVFLGLIDFNDSKFFSHFFCFLPVNPENNVALQKKA
jgi:hypothetical protein